MVGLLPLCAVTVFDGQLLQRYPESNTGWAIPRSASGAGDVHPRPGGTGTGRPSMAAKFDETHLRKVLERMLDEESLQPVRHPIGVAASPRPPVHRDVGDEELTR